ncbi:MAG TPA: 16S rRNA (adenine(1518)-N(6)/adenine(1519)-N(6))-dimethyltransferase RsmA [Bacilli bacterium]|nr:16S rRNA (adenine(1518)-N(6)/adenine(1519)-N(6))-dimethyltransferase RsmA [Bacilli bacterium]HPS18541.1 16S rRNA (adenine(1518)-N(6)/adenine(1519)-N(6))-dimethyltransferase RsmA [Bacilli bacterium]
MIINRQNILEITQKLNVKPDKDYGQNFLIDSDVASQIVENVRIEKNDNILEIGPGLGSLTHFLSLKDCFSCDAVDIDGRMINFLMEIYADNTQIKFIENDIRKIDISNYTKIVGNLPYNITTELVAFLLTKAKLCERFVLMCQTEAFSRLSAINGKEYGAISVLIHLLGSSKKLFVVKPGAFYPSPKCNSTVFEIQVANRDFQEDYYGTYRMAKQLFLNRRKTILNNLAVLLGDKFLGESICRQCQITPTFRPEQISPNQYLAIYKMLKVNGRIKKE